MDFNSFELLFLVFVILVSLHLIYFLSGIVRLFYSFLSRNRVVEYKQSPNLLGRSLSRIISFKYFASIAWKEVNILGWKFTNLSLWVIQFFILNLIFLGVIGMMFSNLFLSYPKMVETYPKWDANWNDGERPIEIIFDRPINTDRLIINMNPETSGTWVFEKSFDFLPFVRQIKYYPTETIFPGQEVIVYFTRVTNVLDTHKNREEMLQFNSVELPRVVGSIPENNSEKIQTNQEIVFKLSHKEGSFVDWEIVTNHKDDTFKFERDGSDILKVKFDEDMNQSDGYIIKVYQIPLSKDFATGEVRPSSTRELAYELQFKTVEAPNISSSSPKGNDIDTNSKISILFDNDMDKNSVEQRFEISPRVEGIKNWNNDRSFVFQPTQLKKGTTYTVSLKNGSKTQDGGVMASDYSYKFSTLGAVKVNKWDPGNGANGISVKNNIRVTFNQPVDKASAEASFQISPNVSGNFSWEGNTMKFQPSQDLLHLNEYSLQINSGVRTINGLDSTEEFKSRFTTEVKRVELAVPLRRQTNSKECQIVATEMILAYKGKGKSKTQIFNEFPKDNTVCNATDNTWGNPHVGFVGDINGNHDCASGNRGYGVYWSPVSNYLSSNGVRNSVQSGWNVQGVAREIDAGNPVIVWWQNGWSSATDVSWNTPDGKNIRAINGMHSEIVVGYIGSAENPTHFILNDPWRQRRVMEVGQFKGLWSYFNNTAIVVY
jgi:uncharacterized protein YvpB